MGAGCSAQTSAHDPQRSKPPPPSHSSSRLLHALGGMAAGLQDQAQTQPQAQPPQPSDPQPQISPIAPSPQEQASVSSPQVVSPDLFPTPVPSPPRTPLAHLLSPGVEIQPVPDQPLLRQRQTIPPMIELDRSTGLSRIQSDAPAKEGTKEPKEQGMVKAATFPIKLPTQQNGLEKGKGLKDELSQDEGDEDGERSTSGMSRASSDEPPSNKILMLPENHRRRNSISVLPSIDPKPKFPGSGGGEGKKTDPDLVLWIANKLKTKLKLTRISKAYDR